MEMVTALNKISGSSKFETEKFRDIAIEPDAWTNFAHLIRVNNDKIITNGISNFFLTLNKE